jgi:hypothetical protein
MLRNTSSRLFVALLLSLPILPATALAQSQDSQAQSVAEAARRAREAKKNAVKPTKVVTDDDMPARTPEPEVQQAAASGTQTSSAPGASGGDATAPAPSNGQPAADGNKNDAAKPTDDPKLAQLKEQVAQAQKEVDLAKREQSLAQDTYYSNPDHARDKAGKIKIDDLQQQVADKQQTLDTLKAQLANYKPSEPPKQ